MWGKSTALSISSAWAFSDSYQGMLVDKILESYEKKICSNLSRLLLELEVYPGHQRLGLWCFGIIWCDIMWHTFDVTSKFRGRKCWLHNVTANLSLYSSFLADFHLPLSCGRSPSAALRNLLQLNCTPWYSAKLVLPVLWLWLECCQIFRFG